MHVMDLNLFTQASIDQVSSCQPMLLPQIHCQLVAW